MTGRQIRDYFVRHATWVDWDHSVDTFKCGDPDAEVRRAAVTWMLTVEAIGRVRELDANFVITHEPTFYSHVDDQPAVADHPVYQRKKSLIDAAGLTVLRIHDSWDPWPGIGIGDSLAALLELGRPMAQADIWRKCYRIEPTRLDDLASRTAIRLGVDPALVAGESDRLVTRVGLFYGALGGLDGVRWAAEHCEAVIAGELTHWKEIRYLEDCGVDVILADHAASENPGMRNLAKFIAEQFAVPTEFVEVGSPFRAVR